MRFVEVKKEKIERRRTKFKLEGELKEFMNMNVQAVKVNFTEHEYKNAKSAAASLVSAIKRYGFPIIATIRRDNVYLIRTDL